MVIKIYKLVYLQCRFDLFFKLKYEPNRKNYCWAFKIESKLNQVKKYVGLVWFGFSLFLEHP